MKEGNMIGKDNVYIAIESECESARCCQLSKKAKSMRISSALFLLFTLEGSGHETILGEQYSPEKVMDYKFRVRAQHIDML